MANNPSEQLLQAIAVTAELTGTDLSPPAARMMAIDLAAYPEAHVMGALTRCRRELKGRLTPSEVISRLEDGRPGPEEAWAMLPQSEAATVVWTAEMQTAAGVAGPLRDNLVQARMAFVEKYREEVRKAREAGVPVRWVVSEGHDPHGREAPILEAIQKGRIAASRAELLPFTPPVALIEEAHRRLERKE